MSVGSGVGVIVGDSVGGKGVFEGVEVGKLIICVFVSVGVLLGGIFVFEGVIVAVLYLIPFVMVGLFVFVAVDVLVCDGRTVNVLVGISVKESSVFKASLVP